MELYVTLSVRGWKRVYVDISKSLQAHAEVIGFWPTNMYVNTDDTFANQEDTCGALMKKLSLEECLEEMMLEIWLKEETERSNEAGEM